ncbi:hypothetical protein DVS28_a0677 [Euzebya pacifica]|uniref:Ig-like domain-containing protein n=1 Tax=Euzebya pacifica TaxID=1608957 RepID=A0A346XT31_9ACTN|nr:hypothetical protein [Euzebya pacifica]AXV05378.1 hypothetical protein DVS28_a0677 [Euzebya pacifica]
MRRIAMLTVAVLIASPAAAASSNGQGPTVRVHHAPVIAAIGGQDLDLHVAASSDCLLFCGPLVATVTWTSDQQVTARSRTTTLDGPHALAHGALTIPGPAVSAGLTYRITVTQARCQLPGWRCHTGGASTGPHTVLVASATD